MKYLFSHIKSIRLLSIFISLYAFNVFSQSFGSDTIPWNSIYLKSTKQGIIETRAENNLTIVINEVLASNSDGIRDGFGEQDDWFELYNYGDEPVKLNDLYFSDDKNEPLKWKFSSSVDTFLAPKNYILFWADNTPEQGPFHVGFKLSAEGEFIGVYTESGDLINGVSFPKQSTDISYGSFPDGVNTFYFFETSTPSGTNDSGGVKGILAQPLTNHKGGFFNTRQTLKLSTQIEQAEIRYTLDFSEPTNTAFKFKDSLLISETTIIRAAVFKKGYAKSRSITISFLFDENPYANPVLSLVGDNEQLFGETGILRLINQDIEIPVNMEFFKDGKSLFSSGSGVHVHSPKGQRQMSLRLYARGVYGNNWFEFPFFDKQGPDKFKRLILRNAGNDNAHGNILGTHFRDPLIHSMAKNTNVHPLVSESKPINVYINGLYYGVYNLRERIDEYYIETHTGVSTDFDLLERAFGYSGNRNVIEGSFDKFSEQVNYVVSVPDKNDSIAFDSIQSMFDIENLRDYWITQVFVGNYDWLSNNVKYWCSLDGKWQWIFWDLDHGLGYPYKTYNLPSWNTLEWSLGFTDRAWSSGYNNRMIRNLLENESFKSNFIQRFTYLINTDFSYPNTTELLDSMAAIYRPDMPAHFNQWQSSNMENWEVAILNLDDYLFNRPENVMEHLQNQFNLEDPVQVSIEVSPAFLGEVEFSTGVVCDSSFSGIFFPGMEYTLIAKPHEGFVFAGWEGIENTEALTSLFLKSDTSFRAFYVAKNNAEPLVINEIYYNNHPYFDAGDWIELVNTTEQSIDISSYQLLINSTRLIIPEATSISANSTLLVVAERKHFQNIYKNQNPLLEFDDLEIPENFTLKLLSKELQILDEVSNTNQNNISALRRKNGYSLELKSIYLDNNEGKHWRVSANRFGSPDLDNNLSYHFSNPNSEDITIAAYNANRIKINVSDFVLYDEDGHGLAGIQFSDMHNRNAFSINGEFLELNEIYAFNELDYWLDATKSQEQFTFSLVDSSVSFTSEHILTISNAVGVLDVENKSLQVYPVPSKNYCTVEGLPKNTNALSLNLWSISGQLIKVFNHVTEKQKVLLDVSDIPNGIYLLTFTAADKNHTIKILIQK